MKKLLTLIVLLCVVALQTYAQTDSVAVAQKQAEQSLLILQKCSAMRCR